MKKPPIMIWLIAALLAWYGISAIINAVQYSQQGFSLNYPIALVAFIGAIGLVLNKYWAQFIVYIYSLLISCYWLYIVWFINRNGWIYDNLQKTVISLIPGVLLLSLCICASYFVYKHYSKKIGT